MVRSILFSTGSPGPHPSRAKRRASRLCGTEKARFIPTCVGNALGSLRHIPIFPVHPHVCGERRVIIKAPLAKVGSSPRVWGTPYGCARRNTGTRFIPTCVGNALCVMCQVLRKTVHPHVCGERRLYHDRPIRISGSSPRVWGTQWR